MRRVTYLIQSIYKQISVELTRQFAQRKKNKVKALNEIADNYTKQNAHQLAFKFYLKAAKKGNVYSQLQLGHIYFDGNTEIAKNDDHAIFWYKKAAEQGNDTAQMNLVELYRCKNQIIESVYWCLKLAEQGNSYFQYKMACFYEEGYGIEKNSRKSLYWREVSAERGNVDAQLDLALSYWNGTDLLEVDLPKAIHWFERAAQQNNAYAQFFLGIDFYRNGLGGLDVNMELAIMWAKKSAKNGHSLAQCFLSHCYMIGYGVEENADQALYWAKLAAEQGDKYLAEVYYYCFEDFNQAFNGFNQSAQQGDAKAQAWLGYLYLNGEGVDKNIQQANYWYKLAAEQGEEEALEYLAENKENL